MSSARSVVPDSPAASRHAQRTWRDPRLVIGVLLVLGSTLLGARVLAHADDAQQVWSASRPLAAGSVLTSSDLSLTRARLYDAGSHYLAGPAPVGYVVQRSLSAGELVPVDAVSEPGRATQGREVAVPVAAGHLPPDLARGDQVDVYVTPEDHGQRTASPRLVLRTVAVARVSSHDSGLTGSTDPPVVLQVDPLDVLALVQAMGEGRLDLVRVPR